MKDHEVRFRYFLLLPKPDAGGKFKYVRTAWRKRSLTDPLLLLVPLYLDGAVLKKAPVDKDALGGQEGFEVKVPKKFVSDHKWLVKVGLFVVKLAVKAAAAQAGVHLNLDFLDGIGNEEFSNLLKDTLTSVVFDEDEEGEIGLTRDAEAKIDGMLAEPEKAVEELTQDGQKELSNDQFASLKAWLDTEHSGWEKNLGLENKKGSDGRVQIVPKGGGGNGTSTPASSPSQPSAATEAVVSQEEVVVEQLGEPAPGPAPEAPTEKKGGCCAIL